MPRTQQLKAPDKLGTEKCQRFVRRLGRVVLTHSIIRGAFQCPTQGPREFRQILIALGRAAVAGMRCFDLLLRLRFHGILNLLPARPVGPERLEKMQAVFDDKQFAIDPHQRQQRASNRTVTDR